MAEVESAVVEGKRAVTMRRRRRWWQFTSRGLLGLITVVAIGLGWLSMKANHARRQRTALAALGANWFAYDFQRVSDRGSDNGLEWNKAATPPGPAILRRLYGDDIFANVLAVRRLGTVQGESLAVLTELDTLEYLDLSGHDLQDGDMAVIGRLTRLKELTLEACNISDADLEHLSQLRQLEELDLTRTRISGTGLAHLCDCKRLRKLMLSDVPINDTGAREIGNLTSITVLCAEWYGPPEVGAGDQILASCSKMRRLDTLIVNGRPVTDEGLSQLRGMPLGLLALQYCQVTDDCLDHIATFGELSHLILSNTRITDAGVWRLRALPKLMYLDLAKTQITDAAVASLCSLPSLASLNVFGCPNITDASLVYLKSFEKLEWFLSVGTHVTEDGLKRFEIEQPKIQVR